MSMIFERVQTDLSLQFEFRVVSHLDSKPISAPDSPSRKKAGGPFIDPREEEVVTDVGPSHRLLLNKFCVYRPMLVLPTTVYAPQSDDLNVEDMKAAWSVLQAFHTAQMVIYNCGSDAGSSVGHKHLQVFPLPDTKSIRLFPEHAESTEVISKAIIHVPFKHFALKLAPNATAADVYKSYQILLAEARHALNQVDATDYNVVFTAKWITVIPRRTAVWGGPQGANAAGMVGMVTVPTGEQRRRWAELGYTDYLVRFGIPLD